MTRLDSVLFALLLCPAVSLAQDVVPVAPGATGPISTDDTEALTRVLRVVVSSGVAGHFADPVCEGDVTLSPAGFTQHAGTLAHAAEPSGGPSLVVDTGGLVQPHGIARYASERSPDALAQLVDGLGYDALAFAYRDLEADRERVLRSARAFAAVGVPYVLSNLRCDATSAALCEAIHDAGDGPLIVARGAEKVAFLAFVDPAALARVTAVNTHGLTIAPLLDAMRDGVRLARARGATIVVVSIDNGVSETAITDALAVAEALEADAKPDLVLAARAGEHMLFTRPASFHPAVAAARPGGVSLIDVRRNIETAAFDMLVTRPTPSTSPSPAIEAFIDAVGAPYCAVLGEPLAGGGLTRALDADALFALATAAVREASDAEIAVLNRGVVERVFAPMRPSGLTASDVFLGLRYDEHVVVATVDAAYVQALARAVAANEHVEMLGLAITNPRAADETITVNGRPLDMRGRYRIATVQFIADGGDGLLPSGVTYEPLPITLRGALRAHLDRPRTVDPRDDFPNPADRLAYAFSIQSDASFGGTVVTNEAEFDASQLARNNNIVFGTQNTLTLTAASTRFVWDNSLVARYRTTRIEDGTREEGDDLIAFRTNARYAGLRSAYPYVYVPAPFAELYVESEFTLPDPVEGAMPPTRTYRHFMLRPTVGLQFTVTPHLGLRINAGVETEVLAPDPDPSFGLGGQLLLAPWTFFQEGARSGTIGGSMDYFASQLGNANRQEIRANLDFGVVLSSFFGLAFTSTLFALKEDTSDFALAFAMTASVRIGWYVRTQR